VREAEGDRAAQLTDHSKESRKEAERLGSDDQQPAVVRLSSAMAIQTASNCGTDQPREYRLGDAHSEEQEGGAASHLMG
jgi:hypothetical protein